jgi:Ca2+-binding EF-hand superfamily protein
LDSNPELRPLPQSNSLSADRQTISLSAIQRKQITEIFNLFDTDGGGTIDRKELDFALGALGFNSNKNNDANDAVNAIVSDGTVTLEEFIQLMMGEVNGRDPMEEIRQIFAVLSKSDGESKNDGYITFNKLESACREFRVCEFVFVSYWCVRIVWFVSDCMNSGTAFWRRPKDDG